MTIDTLLRIAVLAVMIFWVAAGISGMRRAKPDPHDCPECQERPALPPDFKPAKPLKRSRKSVTADRLVRQIHFHDQEEAEARNV